MTRNLARALGLVLLVLAVTLLSACSGDSQDAGTAPSTTAASETSETTAAATPGTTAAGNTTTTAVFAYNAILEPDTVAGIPLGSNKSAAITVFGQPATSGQETDRTGARYDFLRWEFGGSQRGLTLNYRTASATSPLLTDWNATATGPTTALGVSVGGFASAVMSAYGNLQPFCCNSQIASVERGGGRLIVVVDNATRRVTQIIGGDPAYWSRSIAN